ncbi:hypothetical protein [Phenylobacterium sp. J367]|uniref:hypothetical protein n=1 Tax=Phenylobacterium sp. J367 TaxID=2898435 RepID=UPI002150BFD0|nr:hypothetical protein [Phenylobacterium sp. J367]MCR5877754.1 hypothetical protein [Phenylobacterium sp. J367]
MQLVSDTIETTYRTGHKYPAIYPPSAAELWNPERFTHGPPLDDLARLRREAPSPGTPSRTTGRASGRSPATRTSCG